MDILTVLWGVQIFHIFLKKKLGGSIFIEKLVPGEQILVGTNLSRQSLSWDLLFPLQNPIVWTAGLITVKCIAVKSLLQSS